MDRGFWYLATPYSKHPGGIDAAAVCAAEAAAKMMAHGIPVFSPIAHSHSVARHGGIDPLDHDFWMPMDRPIFDAARGVIVVMMDGWDDSKGVRQEIEWAEGCGKPVMYVHA